MGLFEDLKDEIAGLIDAVANLSAKVDIISEGLETPAKKTRAKKTEVIAENAPTLPGGLVITEVDVQQPMAAPANNDFVVATIGTQLDMIAPKDTPNRALLGTLSGQWMDAQGLNRNTLSLEHIAPLIEFCKTQFVAKMQQAEGLGSL